MVEGRESGLLAVLDESELRGGGRDGAWNRSLGELFMGNGSQFKIYSSEKPRQLRGPQIHFALVDEPATFYDAHKGPAEDTTWSNLQFATRLSINGSRPQIVVAGTPRPVRLLTDRNSTPKGLLHREGVAVTRGHTDENLENLAPSFHRAVVERYRGTRLGRQELGGEVLEDAPGALVKRDWIERAREPPPDDAIVRARTIGLDPGGSGSQAMVTVSRTAAQGLYVEHAELFSGTGTDFLRHAVRLAQANRATLVVERNHGGQYLLDLLRRVMSELGVILPTRDVWASTSKRARLEPVALLIEQGRIRWPTVSTRQMEDLVDELSTWNGEGASPHLTDSLVWACVALMGVDRTSADEAELAAVPWTAVPDPGLALTWSPYA